MRKSAWTEKSAGAVVFADGMANGGLPGCRHRAALYFPSVSGIPSPTVPAGDENRHLFCQMAIEIPLPELIQAAVKAGWEETEVHSRTPP
jgi:hypothetical protein